MNRSCRFYRSLRAVKVLFAALRSTLTVLAPRMGGLYRFRVADLSAAIAFSHAARRHPPTPTLKGPPATKPQHYPSRPILGGMKGGEGGQKPQKTKKKKKKTHPWLVGNQQVIGSSPIAGSL